MIQFASTLEEVKKQEFYHREVFDGNEGEVWEYVIYRGDYTKFCYDRDYGCIRHLYLDWSVFDKATKNFLGGAWILFTTIHSISNKAMQNDIQIAKVNLLKRYKDNTLEEYFIITQEDVTGRYHCRNLIITNQICNKLRVFLCQDDQKILSDVSSFFVEKKEKQIEAEG